MIEPWCFFHLVHFEPLRKYQFFFAWAKIVNKKNLNFFFDFSPLGWGNKRSWQEEIVDAEAEDVFTAWLTLLE